MATNTSGHNGNSAYWFVFYNDELLIEENAGIVTIPMLGDTRISKLELTDAQCIGSLNGNKYFAANLCNKNKPKGFSYVKLFQLPSHVTPDYFWSACRAFHIMNWLKNNKLCGRCGRGMNVLSEELAVKCSYCNHIVYPRISPAVIVAVIKDDMILLVRSTTTPPGMYSVVAGFVGPVETLEECIVRELQEEVGIAVTNIKYFGNQPWPFPDSLMIGFTAQYADGEITIDKKEILDAAWFSASNLPAIPPKGSIARQLIDWFTGDR